MDIYENTERARKRSPFADSPYESAYIEPQIVESVEQKPDRPAQKRWGWRLAAAVVLIAACCGVTAYMVSVSWQSRIDRLEKAMQERVDVLEQKYSQNQNQNTGAQLPEQGPMTPGQVYAKNVQAVVAIRARYEKSGSYGESAGSGFIISADGYAVTNYHVVEKASQITVITHGGDSLKAELVGKDEANDVALLKVQGEDLPFVTLGSSDKMAVGDMVAAIGNPLGELTSTLTVGYISAKDRIVSTDGSVINMLQTDAAINSGNSGGPLFNMNGEVVGITTAKYSGSTDSGASIEGLGFAIPMDDIVGILSDLKEFGYVTGAYLGVSVRDVDASAQSYGLPAGAYVVDVTKGYAAEKAGIRAGDIITNLGGHEVDSLTTLTRVLRRFDAGQTVSVTVYRGGNEVYLTITLDEKPVQQEESSGNNQTTQPDNFYDWFGNFLPPFFGG